MATGSDIIKIAKKEIGNAGGQKYWYWIGYRTRVAWCASFVSWVLDQAGAGDLMPVTASCFKLASYATENGLVTNISKATPGDILLFDWQPNGQPDHVGFFISDNEDGTINTIEGNATDAVRECIRNTSDIYMVIHPNYEPEDEPSLWASEACEWCKEQNIFVGDDKGHYNWQDAITREQLAVILYKIKKEVD